MFDIWNKGFLEVLNLFLKSVWWSDLGGRVEDYPLSLTSISLDLVLSNFSCPNLSQFIYNCPNLSYLNLSCPNLSCSNLSYPILSWPNLSCLISLDLSFSCLFIWLNCLNEKLHEFDKKSLKRKWAFDKYKIPNLTYIYKKISF